jgi:hypothetical protein
MALVSLNHAQVIPCQNKSSRKIPMEGLFDTERVENLRSANLGSVGKAASASLRR